MVGVSGGSFLTRSLLIRDRACVIESMVVADAVVVAVAVTGAIGVAVVMFVDPS